jgi:glycosyltransferase involved in cell wall biosynthesis
MQKKVLFLSHNGSVSGAPISLSILMKYFRENTDWDMKFLMVRGGQLEQRMSPDFETFIFHKHFDVRRDTKRIFSALPKGKMLKELKFRMTLFGKVATQALYEKKLIKHYRDWKPDLIYSNTAINGEELRKMKLDAPVIVHVRELDTALDTMSAKADSAFSSDPLLYLAVSRAVKQNLMKRYGINESKIYIAPVALECEEVIQRAKTKTKEQVLKAYSISEEATIIGGIGFINNRKGPDIFLDVAKKYFEKNSNENTCFIWAGDGTDMQECQDFIKENGLVGKVEFVGLVEDIYPLINCFDVFLMTSRDDPFPRVNMESGLLNTPVIAFTESGGSCEYIEKDAGISLDNMSSESMFNALETLLGDDELKVRCGVNGKEKTMKLYDISVVGKSVKSLLIDNFLKE